MLIYCTSNVKNVEFRENSGNNQQRLHQRLLNSITLSQHRQLKELKKASVFNSKLSLFLRPSKRL